MVTYLFTCIENFEHLVAENHYFEDLLQRVTCLIADIVQQHRGKIIKHTNKGVEAVFLAGNAQGIHCALALMLRTQQEHWERVGEIRLQLALHAGEGTEVPLDYLSAYQGQEEDFFGPEINHAAYLMDIGWGGQILVSEQVLNECSLPRHATPRFLGRIPTKEPGGVLEVYQIDHPDLRYHRFPPLKVTSYQHVNLPHFPLPFFGRERELAKLVSLLNNPGNRLVSITGPGGSGKTRLAVQVANELIGFFNGNVFFVPLAQTRDVSNVIPLILDTLHLHPYPKLDPKEQLLSYLRNRRALLLLNNVEQIHGINGVLQELLQGTSRLQILTTSRSRLGLRYETTFSIQGFRPAEYRDAIQIFIESARTVRPDFHPSPSDVKCIEEIIRLLDGLPLGIHLAATTIDQQTCQEILQRLRQGLLSLAATEPTMPDRHRSLAASFRYSWDLLSADEQAVLRDLSLLQDGFDLEAAQEIAGASVFQVRMLVQKSLLTQNESGRFAFPSLFRPWLKAERQHHTEVTAKVRQRKRSFYLERLTNLSQLLQTSHQAKVLEIIALDLPNLLALWDEFLEELRQSSEPTQSLLRIAQPLYLFFHLRSSHLHAEQVFAPIPGILITREGALTEAEERLLTMALLRRAYFLLKLGRRDQAREMAQTGQAKAQANRFLDELAFAHMVHSQIAEVDFDYTTSIRFARLALNTFRQINHTAGIAECLGTLGSIHLRLLELDQAEQYLLESLDAYRQIGDLNGLGRAYNNLGIVALKRNDLYSAMDHLRNSLDIRRQLGNQWAVARILNNMSHIFQVQGNIEQAKQLLDESLEVCRQIGDRYMTGLVLNNLGFIKSFYYKDLASAKIDYLESIQHFLDFAHISTATTYTDLGIAICKHGAIEDLEEARSYLTKAFHWLFENPGFHKLAFQHIVFGWAVYYARSGDARRAAELTACLKQQKHFLQRVTSDVGVRTYFQELETWLEGRLSPKEWAQIASHPPMLEELFDQFQTMLRSEKT